MGVIQTDKWLKADFDQPLKICSKLTPYFKTEKESEIYHQLMRFGMYRPSRITKQNWNFMLEKKIWNKVEKIYQHYKNKWSGPDIPIFLFPMAASGGFFNRQETNKSGVSFPDKMFLFISRLEDIKELEALFVHEYHHVCRLKQINKQMGEFTLLDSIIIEGLAEYAVQQNCGENYLAKWCKMYSERDLHFHWDKYLKNHLSKRKKEKIHDELLYGGGRVPKLLGYSAGYKIVENFYKTNRYSTKLSFSLPTEKYFTDKN